LEAKERELERRIADDKARRRAIAADEIARRKAKYIPPSHRRTNATEAMTHRSPERYAAFCGAPSSA
jgi:hypothetical protein